MQMPFLQRTVLSKHLHGIITADLKLPFLNLIRYLILKILKAIKCTDNFCDKIIQLIAQTVFFYLFFSKFDKNNYGWTTDVKGTLNSGVRYH